jgi:hypothetical protein
MTERQPGPYRWWRFTRPDRLPSAWTTVMAQRNNPLQKATKE